MITGPEAAAAGRVLSQVARNVVADDKAGPSSPAHRTAAYVDFQAAALTLLTWIESTEAIQQSVAPTGYDVLAAALSVAPLAAAGSNPAFGDIARATRPVTLLMLASSAANRVIHQQAIRTELRDFRDATSRVLSALAQVRLVGGPEPRADAENITALLGALLSDPPTVHDRVFQQSVHRHPRHEDIREAIGQQLRRFNQTARMDLARIPLRRRARTSRWQLLRPKLPADAIPSQTVSALIGPAP